MYIFNNGKPINYCAFDDSVASFPACAWRSSMCLTEESFHAKSRREKEKEKASTYQVVVEVRIHPSRVCCSWIGCLWGMGAGIVNSLSKIEQGGPELTALILTVQARGICPFLGGLVRQCRGVAKWEEMALSAKALEYAARQMKNSTPYCYLPTSWGREEKVTLLSSGIWIVRAIKISQKKNYSE